MYVETDERHLTRGFAKAFTSTHACAPAPPMLSIIAKSVVVLSWRRRPIQGLCQSVRRDAIHST